MNSRFRAQLCSSSQVTLFCFVLFYKLPVAQCTVPTLSCPESMFRCFSVFGYSSPVAWFPLLSQSQQSLCHSSASFLHGALLSTCWVLSQYLLRNEFEVFLLHNSLYFLNNLSICKFFCLSGLNLLARSELALLCGPGRELTMHREQ